MRLPREHFTARRVVNALAFLTVVLLALAPRRRGPVIKPPIRPRPEAVEQAKRHQNGWVDQIEGKFGPDDAVPPQAIAGAWKVDGRGQIVGQYVPNPNFQGRRP